MPTTVPADQGAGRRELTRYLHLFALSSLAFAQPLFDLLSRHAEFFVIRRSSPVDVLLLVLALTVLLPLPLVALEAVVVRMSHRLAWWLHEVMIGALSALIFLQALKLLSVDGLPWLLGGTAAGVSFAWAYGRFEAVRQLNSYLSMSLLILPAAFLLHPQIRKLLAGTPVLVELAPTGARTPVVFVLVDELSVSALLDADRRIDAVSYPNLAEFSARATWFPNTTTVSFATEIAVPALLTGKLPSLGSLPTHEEHPANLFTIFGSDYTIWASEPVTRLCPRELNLRELEEVSVSIGSRLSSLFSDLSVVYQHILLPPSYATHLPPISDRWRGFRQTGAGPERAPPGEEDPVKKRRRFWESIQATAGHERRQEFQRFIAALKPDVENSLYFIHAVLPHLPWEYLPSGKKYLTTHSVPGLRNEVWSEDQGLLVQAYQRYLLQAQFVDTLFGALVARLEELGLYERALIVFVSDHGVSFRPGDSRRLLTETNAIDVMPIPLLVKLPFQNEGRVVERMITALDVLPSILDLLEIDPPGPMDGQSFFDPAHEEPERIRGLGRLLEPVEYGRALHHQKYATLEWKLETFGAHANGEVLLKVGPYPELYGQEVGRLGWREQDRVRLHLDGEPLFQQVDPEAPYSPALITGSLAADPPDPDCCALAIAVNGRIFARATAFGRSSEDLRFAALVPETAFSAGDNRVEVFRIRPEGGKTILERLSAPSESAYSLVERRDGAVEAIRMGDVSVPVRVGAVQGFLTATPVADKVTVWGWAVDMGARTAPQLIFVFHGDRLVYSGTTSAESDDVAKALSLEKPVRSAFEFNLPSAALPDLARLGVRLFGLSKSGVASELGFFFHLEAGNNERATTIQATNGRRIPVVPGALEGSLQSRRNERRIEITGWSADVARREPPERVLAFAGRQAIYEVDVFDERQDVAETYGSPEILRCGFRLSFPLGASGESVPEDLRIFAVSKQSTASELRYHAAGRVDD